MGLRFATFARTDPLLKMRRSFDSPAQMSSHTEFVCPAHSCSSPVKVPLSLRRFITRNAMGRKRERIMVEDF